MPRRNREISYDPSPFLHNNWAITSRYSVYEWDNAKHGYRAAVSPKIPLGYMPAHIPELEPSYRLVPE